ncbi:hypothetical protein L2E82_29973 [Cichorium intybus]|uniref:Uncharacterized protein n=1 Tax=Cichorium intybus TaxID=13427 RepID=A0ACB9CZ27_CICIN|nr:hypothetical protein L2E82_29973 [Cichorium intybus]
MVVCDAVGRERDSGIPHIDYQRMKLCIIPATVCLTPSPSLHSGYISSIGLQTASPATCALDVALDLLLDTNNPKQLQQYRGGKSKLEGLQDRSDSFFFLKCAFHDLMVMKESKGKANPGLVNNILLEKLNAKR